MNLDQDAINMLRSRLAAEGATSTTDDDATVEEYLRLAIEDIEECNKELEKKLADSTAYCSGEFPCEASTAAAHMEQQIEELETSLCSECSTLRDRHEAELATLCTAREEGQRRERGLGKRIAELEGLLRRWIKAEPGSIEALTDEACRLVPKTTPEVGR